MKTTQYRKPTVGQVPPRDSGPHGVTLDMLAVKRPQPAYLMVHITEFEKTKTPGRVLVHRVAGFTPYVNPVKDRALPGKARRRARKVEQRIERQIERGQVPADAIAVMHCSCGRTMWLREGADDVTRELFDQEVSQHDWCDDGAVI